MNTPFKPDQIPTISAATESSRSNTPHAAAGRGLAAMFGLDGRAALLAIVVDLMVFGADTFSLECLLPLGIAVAGLLGLIVYKIQRKAGDDKDTAAMKAMIIGLLTAIPVPLTPLVALPGGLLGLVRKVKR